LRTWRSHVRVLTGYRRGKLACPDGARLRACLGAERATDSRDLGRYFGLFEIALGSLLGSVSRVPSQDALRALSRLGQQPSAPGQRAVDDFFAKGGAVELSVPKTHACDAGASGPRQPSEQEIARDLRSWLSSASHRRRGRSSPLSADSMSRVRIALCPDSPPKASEGGEVFAPQAATRSQCWYRPPASRTSTTSPTSGGCTDRGSGQSISRDW
jgi:hypothetical protein